MVDRDRWKELLSIECHVAGIMFYKGRETLQPLMKVKLLRENNPHDPNSIMVPAAVEGRQLGYVDRDTAKVLCPVMDKYQNVLLFAA